MPPVCTVGHSTRSLAELVALLQEHGVALLVDVRRYPGSRRHPQFGREVLARALAEAGLGYRHEPDLGGRRQGRPGSPHVAWRSAGFRAYADHMETEAFQQALARLLELAPRQPLVLMCAEAVPWRCHRQLIADALVARGRRVVHILGPRQSREHELHPAARLAEGVRLIYDRVGEGQLSIFGPPP